VQIRAIVQEIVAFPEYPNGLILEIFVAVEQFFFKQRAQPVAIFEAAESIFFEFRFSQTKKTPGIVGDDIFFSKLAPAYGSEFFAYFSRSTLIKLTSYTSMKSEIAEFIRY
jgi:hypothetical protein